MIGGLSLEVAIRHGPGAESCAGFTAPHPSRRFALQSSSGMRDWAGAGLAERRGARAQAVSNPPEAKSLYPRQAFGERAVFLANPSSDH